MNAKLSRIQTSSSASSEPIPPDPRRFSIVVSTADNVCETAPENDAGHDVLRLVNDALTALPPENRPQRCLAVAGICGGSNQELQQAERKFLIAVVKTIIAMLLRTQPTEPVEYRSQSIGITFYLAKDRRKAQAWLRSVPLATSTTPKHLTPSAFADRDLQRALETLSTKLPVDYETRKEVISHLSEALRTWMAKELAQSLLVILHLTPHETLEDKKRLAEFANAQLREFGLAIRCPKTGRPSRIYAHPGDNPAFGRFQLENVDEDGKSKRPWSSIDLPAELELMPDDLSRVRRSWWLTDSGVNS